MKTREFTFQNLFGSFFDLEGIEIVLQKIEIPIIQRDYAQGRKNDEVDRIRARFLDALLNSVINKRQITLDFVYGDVSKEGVLTPLDGQQRLTTLFLLHWYVAKKEKLVAKEFEFLEHFSYATRFSSRDFCQELVKYSPDFSKVKISESIKDQPWYPYEWKNDPTIKSMLVMIDAIHEKFNDCPALWKSLVTDKNIIFYFLPLKEMGLTDDLYIKMNSRGKPLTQFEHFKAEFGEIIKKVSGNIATEINHKFDVEWTDMLFPFRGDNHIIDDEFMRYFHFISDIICYKNDFELEADEFKVAKMLYSNENFKAKANIEFLKSSFDCWHNFNILDFFNKYFSKFTYEKGKIKLYQDDLNLFKECCDNYGEFVGRNRKFPLNKILILYSIITYLQNKDKVDENEFRKRIRIIRNLILNSVFEIRDERMKTLLSEAETIMLTGEIPISEKGDIGFNLRQKEEERNKIDWLKANPQMLDELCHLEDHALLKGCIAIVGLKSSMNFRKFRLLFDNCDKDTINRVLLSIDDYSQLVSWRYQIGAKSNESVWFDLFHPSKQRQGFDKTARTINEILSDLDESDINNAHLEKIINNYLDDFNTPKDWRFYVIKYNAMRKGNFGMYYWKDRFIKPYELIMMNTEKSIGGKNWNAIHYVLKNFPEFDKLISIGDYAYQGDTMKLINSDIDIQCFNDKYLVSQNGIQSEYIIQQINGIDIEDRVEKGKQIISDFLRNETQIIKNAEIISSEFI
jgi:hypothetical protein